MTDRALHLPQDLAAREEVRLLARAFSARTPKTGELAALVVICLCLGWARGGKPHRAYREAGTQPGAFDDPLCHLVAEEVLLFLGQLAATHVDTPEARAALFSDLTKSGVLTEETVERRLGLTLCGFAEFNEHLHPGFKSIQRKGKEAQNRSRALAAALKSAPQARKLLEQAAFAFPAENPPTEAEKEATLAFIMQLHISLDLPLPQVLAEWSPVIFRDALHIIRTRTAETLTAVYLHIWDRLRGSKAVTPEDIIARFPILAAEAAAL